MKITTENYFQTIEGLDFKKLPLILRQSHAVILTKTIKGQDWSKYKSNPDFRRMAQAAFKKLEEYLGSKSLNGQHLTPKIVAMNLIRPYVLKGDTLSLHPTFRLATRNGEYAAHVEGDEIVVTMLFGTPIREAFKVSTLIKEITEEYLKNKYPQNSFTVDRNRTTPAKQKRKTYKHMQPEFKILKAILAWDNLLVTRNMVASFINQIKGYDKDKSLKQDSPVYREIKLVEDKLEAILKAMDETITVRLSPETKKLWRAALKKVTDPAKNDKGNSLSGVPVPQSQTAPAHKPGIISSEDFARADFKTIGFKGKWKDLMGDPCPGFKAAVSGMPKMGKSFLCVEFAKYLASNHGKVIYITKEEFMSPTFQIKIREKGAANPNLDIAGEIPADLSAYQYIFIDSVTSLKLTPDDLRKLEESNPGKSFIYVHQVNKAGKVRGTNEFLHNVDIIIEIRERGKATQYGRYNQGGEMDIFQSESQAPSVSGLDGVKGSKRYAEEGSAFVYVIDLDERGSFRAHVEDPAGNTVFEIAAGDELEEGESSIFEDGFMKHKEDIRGLEKHLKDLQIITPEDWLVDESELNGKPGIEDKMEIEVEVAVPYEVISMALFADEQSDEEIEIFEENQPEKLDETIKEICEDELSNSQIKVIAVRRMPVRANMDGFFLCKVTLKGTESELRERAGEGEIFMYDWSSPEQKMTNSYLKKIQSKKQ